MMIRSTIIIGLFVTITAVVSILYITLAADGIGVHTYDITAYLNNANGLLKDSPVRISGVKIGRIKEIGLQNNKAVLTLEIQNDITLHQNDILRRVPQGILGSSFLAVVPSGQGAKLSDGDSITFVEDTSLMETLGSSAGDITNNVSSISKQVDDYLLQSGILHTITRIADELATTITNIRSISSDLAQTTKHNTAAINAIVASTASITSALEYFLSNDKLQDNQNLADTLQAIKNTLTNIERITAKLDNGEGTVGKLLTDDTLYNNINEATTNLRKITQRAAGLNTTFDYRIEGMMSDDIKFTTKNHINLRIEPPNSTRYYQIGISTGGPENITGVNTKYKTFGNSGIKLNLMLGQRLWNNIITVRGGLIENTGGIGLDIAPFSQWELSAEAFNFGSSTGIPYIRAFTSIYPLLDPTDQYNPLHWLYFNLGSDDILNTYKRTYFIGLGIRLKDNFIYDAVRLVPLAGAASTIAK